MKCTDAELRKLWLTILSSVRGRGGCHATEEWMGVQIPSYLEARMGTA